MTGFWLNDLIRRLKVPYPIFFGLISVLLYLIGIPFMIATGNLQYFLSEPNWIYFAIYGMVSGISIIYIYRNFLDSLSEIKNLFYSENEFLKIRAKLLGYLTHKIAWFFVTFWPLMTIRGLIIYQYELTWWSFYDQTFFVTLYYFIEGIPVWIFGGLFFYMIPFGLNLAYRELCLKTTFKDELLSAEWMESFTGFKKLITVTMVWAVINSLLIIIIWTPTFEQSPLIYLPYMSMIVILIPTIIYPHYSFHKLFSRMKTKFIKEIRRQLVKIPDQKKNDKISEILILLRKSEIERMKTSLLDVKILAEVITVALLHVIIIEILTSIIHN